MTDWRNTLGTNHNHRLIALLNNGLGNPYDVTFVVGPAKEEVKGHQFILRLHSSVFEEKFNKENNVCPIVNVEDGNKQDFEQFLKILYTGNMWDHANQAAMLLKYAVEFKVCDLEEWCWKRVEKITEQSAVTAYELAIKFGKTSVRDQALEFILSNASTILDSDEFLNFTSHNLSKVLASDKLTATDESQVFRAVLRWGKEMCRRDGVQPIGAVLRNVLTDVLPMVRFPVMSKSDFSMMVAPLELLTDKELISILLYFNIDKDRRDEIPPGAFNGKERSWLKKPELGQEYLLHRLEPLPNDPDLRQQLVLERLESTWLNLTADSVHELRFSVDHPIWVTSVGVNAEMDCFPDGAIDSEITFRVVLHDEDPNSKFMAYGTGIIKVGDAQLNKTFQLQLSKAGQIQPGVWYNLGILIDEGVYIPKLYVSALGCDGSRKSIHVEGKTINFRFEEDSGIGLTVIGLTQGLIPTIGFKLDDPKAQQ